MLDDVLDANDVVDDAAAAEDGNVQFKDDVVDNINVVVAFVKIQFNATAVLVAAIDDDIAFVIVVRMCCVVVVSYDSCCCWEVNDVLLSVSSFICSRRPSRIVEAFSIFSFAFALFILIFDFVLSTSLLLIIDVVVVVIYLLLLSYLSVQSLQLQLAASAAAVLVVILLEFLHFLKVSPLIVLQFSCLYSSMCNVLSDVGVGGDVSFLVDDPDDNKGNVCQTLVCFGLLLSSSSMFLTFLCNCCGQMQ